MAWFEFRGLEGLGRREGEQFSFLTACWMKLSFSRLDLACRLCNLLSEGSTLKRECDTCVGSPETVRAFDGWDGLSMNHDMNIRNV